MIRRFVPSPSGQLHVVDAGAPDAPTIVLLHQTPRSVDEYAEVIPLLARAHRVIAIDTVGYGCSDRVTGTPTVADYADGVIAIIDALGIDRALLVGHHTGAFIAVEVAAAHPERVSGLVLSGPVYMDAAAREQLAPWFVQWHPAVDGSHCQDKWTRLGRWVSDPSLRQRLLADVFRAGETSEQGHHAILQYDMGTRLPLVRARVLLLYASGDPFVNLTDAARFQTGLGGPATIEQIDGGIFLPTERPEAFARVVASFATTSVS